MWIFFVVNTSVVIFRLEMFYQIMMYEFGNLGVIKFSVSIKCKYYKYVVCPINMQTF